MKKALHLVIASLLLSAAAQAQITKGKILLGGTLAYYGVKEKYSNNNYNPTKQRSFAINPSVGKVINENLVLGIEANLNSTQLTYDNVAGITKTKSKLYGGAIFLRKYVPLLKQFYFFGQGGIGFSNTKSSQTYINQTTGKSNGWGAALTITPGLTYAITKKIYVEAGLNSLVALGYSHQKSESTNIGTGDVSSAESNVLNFSTSLGSNGSFNIGFKLLL